MPQNVPDVVTSFCPHHGWTNYARHNTGSDSPLGEHTFVMASPRHAILPSPEYTPATPLYTPTPVEPLEFLLRGTIAARRGAPLFCMSTGGGYSSMTTTAPLVFNEHELAPPPPPPSTTVAANRHPGMRRNMIPTGHIPEINARPLPARR
ncbi:hypothetical protein PR202_gb16039 [Eleusine coracana subsp. coracana]|uniref:Uncharacterized protein n=1 Tax=Eleusine coracana subsp. coracana TaxID=191504 RepID=A0AAV5EX61_ELECO|nr:hypothetical protein PR202_gb16039 [Eleusine coracana subsp. coracana]